MMDFKHDRLFSVILATLIFVLSSCSTTKKLPAGEVLYTGIKQFEVVGPPGEQIDPEASSQVEQALKVDPNNTVLGIHIPIPFGLWMYNWFKTDKKKGIKKWLFDKLAADPVLISKVDPSVRAKAAETLMDDNGYFNGKVRYEIIPDKKNERKAQISYFLDYKQPYRYKSVEYMHVETPSDSIIRSMSGTSLLKAGQIFNVNTLEDERNRISSYLRNNGYYYFRPDFISYIADSTGGDHEIALRVVPKVDLPKLVLKPWRIGKIDYSISNSSGNPPTDTIEYQNMGVFYRHRIPVKPRILHRALAFKPGDWYSQSAADATQLRLNRLNTFRFAEIGYMPADTIHAIDSLNVLINTTLELPIDAEIELNVTTKSNNQTGPGMIFGITHRNVFRGGEVLNTQLSGSYEWQTGAGAKNAKGNNLINSYELGVTSSLIYPRLIAPRFMHRDFKFAATTTYKLNADILSRAGFFRLLNMGGSMNYDFKSSQVSTHTVTPLSLTYSYLLKRTAAFDSVLLENKALQLSFENQFIPSMSYTYTYDNSSVTSLRNHLWWQSSITQAGNVLYGAMELFGNKQGNHKTIFGNPFSQFVKLSSEIRYYYKLWGRNMIASRFMAGVLKPYLNSEVAPYSEQFFIGGANSIRAFEVRSIGPGSYHPAENALYSYLDQTGTLKLEANIEYRFPIVGSLFGAVFLDAGNVWLLKKDEKRPGGEFTWNSFGKDIALGTGAGVRLDITYLVIRFDVGVPIHAPYDTGRKGYYNIKDVWKNLGYHLAIGYPF
ncbi:MAG: BamA/TamA family outer membrane protein [Bacteroidales bacterium]